MGADQGARRRRAASAGLRCRVQGNGGGAGGGGAMLRGEPAAGFRVWWLVPAEGRSRVPEPARWRRPLVLRGRGGCAVVANTPGPHGCRAAPGSAAGLAAQFEPGAEAAALLCRMTLAALFREHRRRHLGIPRNVGAVADDPGVDPGSAEHRSGTGEFGVQVCGPVPVTTSRTSRAVRGRCGAPRSIFSTASGYPLRASPAARSLVTAINVRFRPRTSWKSWANRRRSSATASLACTVRDASISQIRTRRSIHSEAVNQHRRNLNRGNNALSIEGPRPIP